MRFVILDLQLQVRIVSILFPRAGQELTASIFAVN